MAGSLTRTPVLTSGLGIARGNRFLNVASAKPNVGLRTRRRRKGQEATLRRKRSNFEELLLLTEGGNEKNGRS